MEIGDPMDAMTMTKLWSIPFNMIHSIGDNNEDI